jgi:nicotinate-nucleotide pyrophosphorylase (carboxylating)
MKVSDTYGLSLDEFIRTALAEDVGDGDHTSRATIESNKTSKAVVKVKEDGIISGLTLAQSIFRAVDASFRIEPEVMDAAEVHAGKIVMTITGNTRNLLKAERFVLNCLQRMSGIATLTRRYVDAVEGTGAKILDTRKTTPNFRAFEKIAVRAGGGFNHRSGLYDMILIKDNHVDAAGGIAPALNKAAAYLLETGKKLMIEIETRNIEEVEEVIQTGIAQRIMLDNFDPVRLREAVERIGKRFETEASGGITLDSILSYAKTGVQYISVGALTHSYKSLDISMKITG